MPKRTKHQLTTIIDSLSFRISEHPNYTSTPCAVCIDVNQNCSNCYAVKICDTYAFIEDKKLLLWLQRTKQRLVRQLRTGDFE